MTFHLTCVHIIFSSVHYENTPMNYTAIFHGCKNDHFQLNCFHHFHNFAQNIDGEF